MIKIVDFGLVILIWMTQLVVYPSFTYFQSEDLIAWHSKYTTAISVIVMPLMLTQVALHGYFLLTDYHLLRLIAATLIGLVWINTFFFAVPLHNQIGASINVQEAAQSLVKVNWYRTILWTLVFLLSAVGEKLLPLR
ncbi:MAG: hypothetical protein AAF789_05515 [Bacteroidota bacterium]